MSAIKRSVRNPHFRAQRNSNLKRVLMPRRDGTLEVFEAKPDGAHLVPVISSQAKQVKKRGTGKGVVRAQGKFDEAALKLTDVVAFNMKAESFFVHWLGEAIRGTGYKGKSISWVFPNAAMDLGISIATAKRYFAKHTADHGEFYSDGETVKFREDR